MVVSMKSLTALALPLMAFTAAPAFTQNSMNSTGSVQVYGARGCSDSPRNPMNVRVNQTLCDYGLTFECITVDFPFNSINITNPGNSGHMFDTIVTCYLFNQPSCNGGSFNLGMLTVPSNQTVAEYGCTDTDETKPAMASFSCSTCPGGQL
jgi:hypothetical protein